MATGRVKWFNNSKGYGFIIDDDTGNELFVHFSAIEGSGFKTLAEREQVEFDVQTGEKGLQAVNIRRDRDADSGSDPELPSE